MGTDVHHRQVLPCRRKQSRHLLPHRQAPAAYAGMALVTHRSSVRGEHPPRGAFFLAAFAALAVSATGSSSCSSPPHAKQGRELKEPSKRRTILRLTDRDEARRVARIACGR
ncbi:hypothetical protein GCM10022251_78960 [Phytohabitans flavus]|uniref:Uncharacterized protein n=1 Tax=Phytohabitans flavus TaxID=1076124 RepID=A0A6F8XLS8_9ACTN|nr:hypothetical protein Pflav_011760 [Phytohabitans flavus]